MRYQDLTESEKNEVAFGHLCWLFVFLLMLACGYFKEQLPALVEPIIGTQAYYEGEFAPHVDDPGFVPTQYTYIAKDHLD